jgi:hypothetical protein
MMRAPKKTQDPDSEAEVCATTLTSNDSTAAVLVTTTTRTCGSECWCKVSAPMDYNHRQYMDTLARKIRILEVSQRVEISEGTKI